MKDGKSKIKVLVDLESSERSILVNKLFSSYCVLRQQKEQGSYLGSVKRALILFMRASPL